MKKISLRSGLMATTTICGAALSVMAGGALVATVATMLPTVAQAQDYTSGDFTGTVADSSGAPLAGAAVTMVSPQGATYTATTGANGEFIVRGLQVGSYSVDISKDGFDAVKATVAVAPVSSTYAFSMAAAGEGTTVVVKGAKRRNDFAKNDIGASVSVQELSSRVPVGRSINAITMLTPGASAPDASINASSRRNQSLVSLAGTSAAESSYYINGVQATDQRTFLGYADLPFDFIDTIETKTGGYSAEFGRGTGGVVNIVTRSGTNKWTGGVSLNWSPDSLRTGFDTIGYIPGGNNIAGVEAYNQYAKSDAAAASFYIGGPIIKDHLFIFANYEARDNSSTSAATFNTTMSASTGVLTKAATGTVTDSSYDDPRWGVKLDWVINPDHRFEYTIFSDATTTSYKPYTISRATGDRTAAQPEYTEESGGTNQVLKYTGKLSDWLTVSALWGHVENKYLDYGSAVTAPGVLNLDTNVYDNSRRFGLYDLGGEDVRDTLRFSADTYFDLLGSHHLKVGYDQEKLETHAYSAYNGGAIYYYGSNSTMGYTSPTGTVIEKLTFANNGTFKADQTAIYIQDFWRITPTFSVQIGLRNDIYDYKNINGETYIKIDDQIAPRLAFNWDPTGAGTDRVYGSVGDYYLPIATNTSVRASSGEIYTDEYFTGTLTGGTITKDANGTPVTGTLLDRIYYSPPGAPDTRAVAVADLKPMYEREFILGYEHTFTEGSLADWKMGLRYINRNLESTIEDTAIGDAVGRYCARVGTCTAAPSSYYPYVLFNPGEAATVFVDLEGDAKALGDGSNNPDYNPQKIELTKEDLAMPEAKRTYQALEFTFARPFDGTWGVGGSYTLARSHGNYEGAVKSDIGQTDTSITQDFDHSANELYATGDLPNGHTHTFKIYGNYMFNDRFSVGANFLAQSGRKYGCIGVVPTSADPSAPQTGTPSGWYCPGNTLNTATSSAVDYLKEPSPRGSRGETEWLYQLDMNMSYKVLETETRGNVTATVDIFNLLDSHAVTRVVEQGEIRSTTKGLKAPYYGMPRSYQSPRSVRVGLRYTF